jgi:hypothetical protein
MGSRGRHNVSRSRTQYVTKLRNRTTIGISDNTHGGRTKSPLQLAQHFIAADGQGKRERETGEEQVSGRRGRVTRSGRPPFPHIAGH